MVLAAQMFDKVAGESGPTLSVPKTKLLVAGTGVTSDDLAPLELDEGVVDVVDQFKYLGSLVEARGGVVAEVSNGIAQASRAFGSLCNFVFTACFRLDLGDQENGVPICGVGGVVVWC